MHEKAEPQDHGHATPRGRRGAGIPSAVAVGAIGLLCLTAGRAHSGDSGGVAGSVHRPNILLLLTDDQRWDAVGYAAEGPPSTPNLDTLARRGMIFTAAYCASMPCVPSRASVMAGLHHHRWTRGPKYGLGRGLSEQAWTWSHALQEAGYRTALVGKMHFSPRHADHGFDLMQTCDHPPLGKTWDETEWHDDYDDWLQEKGLDRIRVGHRDWKAGLAIGYKWPADPDLHPIAWVRDRAVRFLEQAAVDDRPFAAVVSFRFPHSPIVPAEPYASMYDPESVPVPERGWSEMKNMPPRLREWEDRGWRIDAGAENQRAIRRMGYKNTEDAFRRMWAGYWGLCTQLDDAIGKILQQVDLSRTLVIFTSDHGVYFGHRRRLFKSPLIPLDHIARVPLVAAGPGVPEGTRCETPASLLDLAPTFVTAAGARPPDRLDGVPLQRYFKDQKALPERVVYCYGRDGFDMVRRGRVKYYLSHDGEAEMLFDLSADPGEWRNVVDRERWKPVKKDLEEDLKAIRNKPPVNAGRQQQR